MHLLGSLKALHLRQLQLADDRVVLIHEVFFALEPALVDPSLRDAPRTTQAGAETMFVELWAGYRVFIVVKICRGDLVDDDERLNDSVKGDKLIDDANSRPLLLRSFRRCSGGTEPYGTELKYRFIVVWAQK